jgi:hypothetical protein
MSKGHSLISDLFFIILVIVIGFFAHNRITNSDHYDCNEEVKNKIDQVLSYQKDLWEIQLPASIRWLNLSQFKIDLNNIKKADIQMEWLNTKYEKMRYSWMTRIYDATVEIKLKNAELRDFSLNIPITCTSSSSETKIEFRKVQ